MTDLNKLRDELAEDYAFKVCEVHGEANATDMNHEEVPFKAGWDACIQALTEASGEFDEKFAIQAATYPQDGTFDSDFVDGARWQFEADAKRIGLAENIVRDREQREHLLRIEIKQLEARLAESEARGSADLIAEKYRLREKLSAAEARCRELSQLLKDKGIR